MHGWRSNIVAQGEIWFFHYQIPPPSRRNRRSTMAPSIRERGTRHVQIWRPKQYFYEKLSMPKTIYLKIENTNFHKTQVYLCFNLLWQKINTIKIQLNSSTIFFMACNFMVSKVFLKLFFIIIRLYVYLHINGTKQVLTIITCKNLII